jgi:hypothetical protein
VVHGDIKARARCRDRHRKAKAMRCARDQNHGTR